ncbi:MAG: hypothetical protein M3N51_12030 [Actinomycetota bacterium]|nr:hypothetical protein [Actinomycetota bacterium]
MSWLDALLGRTKPKQPDLDALFALPGAAVTLQVAVGLLPSGWGAVSFKPASNQAFTATGEELHDLLGLAIQETESRLHGEDDRYGYRWVVLEDPDMEDLVTTVHLVNSTLEARGFGSQLLCSVFGFATEEGRSCHLVYLYKRGTFYPFAPRDGERRDNELELRVRGAVESDLPVEEDLSRWFPIWGVPAPR